MHIYYEVLEYNDNMWNKDIMCVHLSMQQVSYNILEKNKMKNEVIYFLSKWVAT